MLGELVHAHPVVGGKRDRTLRLGRRGEAHIGHAVPVQRIEQRLVVADRRRQDHRVAAHRAQALLVAVDDGFRVIVEFLDDEMITILPACLGRAAERLVEIIGAEVRHEAADEIGARRGEGPGGEIDAVARLFDRRFHPPAGLLADMIVAVDDSRDGLGGNAGHRRDVGEGGRGGGPAPGNGGVRGRGGGHRARIGRKYMRRPCRAVGLSALTRQAIVRFAEKIPQRPGRDAR